MIANRVEPQRLAGASLLNRGPEHLNRANNEPVVCLMTKTIDGINNLREIRILLVPDGVHTAPNALALALGAPADRDLTHLTCSNTKAQMRANAQSHHNLAGICCASGAVGSIGRKQGFQRVTSIHDPTASRRQPCLS